MKQRYNITLEPATQDRLLIWGEENHITGGLSGAIEYLAWHQIKVKPDTLRGQQKIRQQ